MLACIVMAHGVEVVSYEGKVDVTLKGQDVSAPAKAGMEISAGDRIVTGEKSSARLSFSSESEQTIDINEQSDVIVKLQGGEKIELISGEVFAKIKGLKKGEEFQVRTPSATCGARGTAWVATANADKTDISVIDGSVFTRGINRDGTLMKKEYMVKKGYEREIKRFKKPKGAKKMPKNRIKKIETRFTRGGIKFSPVISRTGDLAGKDISTRTIVDTNRVSVDKIESLEKRDVLDSRMIDDRVDSKVIERSDRMDKRDDVGSRREVIRKPPSKRPPIRKPIIRR